MSNGAKIFIWILLLLLVVAIIYIFVLAKKQPAPAPKAATNPDGTTPEPITTTVEKTQFNAGDEIYAGEDTLNAYKDCHPGVNSFLQTFNSGDLIGKFVRRDGICIVVRGQYGINVPLTGIFIPTSTRDYYILYNAKIYK